MQKFHSETFLQILSKPIESELRLFSVKKKKEEVPSLISQLHSAFLGILEKMSLYPFDNLRARSLSRALTPFVSISELDDANQVVSRKNYSYRSSTVPPMLYDSSAVSRRYYGDWLTTPLYSSYRYPLTRYRSSYYYDDILPYSRYTSDYGNSIARITIRTPPPVNNYLQPIYKTYRHYSSPQYHYHTLPATPIVRNETYAPIYHYHYEPTRTRTTTTTRTYRSLPTYTPIYDTSYYWTSRYLY